MYFSHGEIGFLSLGSQGFVAVSLQHVVLAFLVVLATFPSRLLRQIFSIPTRCFAWQLCLKNFSVAVTQTNLNVLRLRFLPAEITEYLNRLLICTAQPYRAELGSDVT